MVMDEQVYDECNLFTTFESAENGDENEVPLQCRTKSESRSLSELDSLKQENILLKRLLRKIGANPSEDEPLANILFYNGPSSYETRGQFEDFICHIGRFISQKQTSEKSSLSSEASSSKRNLTSDGFAIALGRVSGQRNLTLEEYNVTDLPVGCVQYFPSFCVDKFGSDVERIFPEPPSIERMYFITLPEEKGSRISQRRCFNCDGDHTLNDCLKPRDLARISAKRKEFLESKYDSRYHVDQTKEKQYEHLTPGKVSEKLQEALNMLSHDLPPFIYRMRMLGYPTGWLPSSNDSGIVMYGKEGREEQNSELVHLDPDKYVHFPGFNVPVPTACKDLAYEVHLPMMQNEYQLDVQAEDELSTTQNESCKRDLSVEDYDSAYHDQKKMRTSSDNDMDVEDDAPGTSGVIEAGQPSNTAHPGDAPVTKWTDLEDGEIAESPETNLTDQPSWWFKEPLEAHVKNDKEEFVPPPFPLRPLPLHKISQILPGEVNHITFEDRGLWLDPIFGNLQVRTGRYDKLRTILSARENKRKSL